ncbi:hypothetical protein EZS27_041916, partial [termite gut metagenome]
GLSTYEHTTKISTGHPKSKVTEDNLLIVNQNCFLNRLGAEDRAASRIVRLAVFTVNIPIFFGTLDANWVAFCNSLPIKAW